MSPNDDADETLDPTAFTGLERRRRRGRSAEGRRSLPVSFDEWYKNLALCCQRYSRSKNEFAVAQLSILEYAHVKERLGEEASLRLKEAAVRVMKEMLRKEDLFVSAGNGDFLILLPEASAEESRQAMDRLAADLAESQSSGWHEPLRMSCVFSVASPAAELDLDSVKTVENSPREILRALGYDADSHGRLRMRREDWLSGDASSTADFDTWLKRYRQLKKRGTQPKAHVLFPFQSRMSLWDALDHWRDDRPVTIKAVHLEGARVDCQSVIRAARILQDGHLCGIARVLDFFLRDDSTLYLVVERLRPWKQFKSGLPEKIRAELLSTVLEILTQLAEVTSHTVPLPVDQGALRLRQDIDEPVFDDYELFFLPGILSQNESGGARQCLNSIRQMLETLDTGNSGYKEHYERIRQYLEEKSSADKLQATLKKSRSELKKIIEQTKRGEEQTDA